MVEVVRAWIIRQLTLGTFSSRRDVLSKSMSMAAKIAVLVYALTVLSHVALGAFDLLPFSLMSALVVVSILCPPISFGVAVTAYSVVGLAVYDLGVSHRRFEMLSRTDMLSGLMNRRAFLEEFERLDGRTSLIIFDIDRFKAINDGLGHTTGDNVIAKMAQVLADAAPPVASVSRIGGEEFAVLLPGFAISDALHVAEVIRHAVESAIFVGPAGSFPVTVSAGVAEGAAVLGFSDIFSQADRALYFAKAAGRNRIVDASNMQSGIAGEGAVVSQPPATFAARSLA